MPNAFHGIGDLRFADPVKYLMRFDTKMEVYQVEGSTNCRVLASNLRDHWFQSLGPDSIDSWEQMMKMFLTQFQSLMQYAPSVTAPTNIRHRETKTLHSYFKSLNLEVPLMRGAMNENVKNFLIVGVRVGSDF